MQLDRLVLTPCCDAKARRIAAMLRAFYRRWGLQVDVERCRLAWPLAMKPIPAGLTGASLWALYASSVARGHMRPSEYPEESTHAFDFCLREIPRLLYVFDGDEDLDANMVAFASEFLRAVFPSDAIRVRMDDTLNVAAKRETTRGAVQYCVVKATPPRDVQLVYTDSDTITVWDALVDY